MNEKRPCVNCDTRKTYARLFDIHIMGEDCPYVCKKYEEWKKRNMSEKDRSKDKNGPTI